MAIFVIAQNGGCEGMSAPVQAFEREDHARAALALASQSGGAWNLFIVPVWPETAEPYYSIKPIA